MTAIMDLSFPGQRTATATSCIPHDSVYMPGPRAGKSENGFFRCDTWLQIFQNDSKIHEAKVTVTPLINKICKPWTDMVTNVANIFSLATKNSGLVASLVTRFLYDLDLHLKRKVEQTFDLILLCFRHKNHMT